MRGGGEGGRREGEGRKGGMRQGGAGGKEEGSREGAGKKEEERE